MLLRYLDWNGVVISVNTRDMGQLIVLSPQWLCRDVIGSVLMPEGFCGSAVDCQRRVKDERDGVVRISELRQVFKHQTEAVVRVLQHMEVCVVGDMEDDSCQTVRGSRDVDQGGEQSATPGSQSQCELCPA